VAIRAIGATVRAVELAQVVAAAVEKRRDELELVGRRLVDHEPGSPPRPARADGARPRGDAAYVVRCRILWRQ
jgi:hypothetical protein